MELKDYQANVLTDLSSYLDTLLKCQGHLAKAFVKFWQDRGVLKREGAHGRGENLHRC